MGRCGSGFRFASLVGVPKGRNKKLNQVIGKGSEMTGQPKERILLSTIAAGLGEHWADRIEDAFLIASMEEGDRGPEWEKNLDVAFEKAHKAFQVWQASTAVLQSMYGSGPRKVHG